MIRWTIAGAALFAIAVVTMIMVVRVVTEDRSDMTDLEIGDCFDMPVSGDDGTGLVDVPPVEVIDCDVPHNAQVIALGDLNPGGALAYPADDELVSEVDAACARASTDPRFGIVPIVPTQATWVGRDGRYLCVALTYGLEPITGDHTAVATSTTDPA